MPKTTFITRQQSTATAVQKQAAKLSFFTSQQGSIIVPITVEELPPGYAYLTDNEGIYITDNQGIKLIVPVN